jgi:hypothetical protein
MLKDLIKFSKFRYGRGVMVPYWVGQSPSQEMFPNKTLSRSCNEYEVYWGNTLGHGVFDISRAHIVSFMGAFVEGVLHLFFCTASFFQDYQANLATKEPFEEIRIDGRVDHHPIP